MAARQAAVALLALLAASAIDGFGGVDGRALRTKASHPLVNLAGGEAEGGNSHIFNKGSTTNGVDWNGGVVTNGIRQGDAGGNAAGGNVGILKTTSNAGLNTVSQGDSIYNYGRKLQTKSSGSLINAAGGGAEGGNSHISNKGYTTNWVGGNNGVVTNGIRQGNAGDNAAGGNVGILKTTSNAGGNTVGQGDYIENYGRKLLTKASNPVINLAGGTAEGGNSYIANRGYSTNNVEWNGGVVTNGIRQANTGGNAAGGNVGAVDTLSNAGGNAVYQGDEIYSGRKLHTQSHGGSLINARGGNAEGGNSWISNSGDTTNSVGWNGAGVVTNGIRQANAGGNAAGGNVGGFGTTSNAGYNTVSQGDYIENNGRKLLVNSQGGSLISATGGNAEAGNSWISNRGNTANYVGGNKGVVTNGIRQANAGNNAAGGNVGGFGTTSNAGGNAVFQGDEIHNGR